MTRTPQVIIPLGHELGGCYAIPLIWETTTTYILFMTNKIFSCIVSQFLHQVVPPSTGVSTLPIRPPEMRRPRRSNPRQELVSIDRHPSPLFNHRDAVSANLQTSVIAFFRAVPVIPSSLNVRHRDCPENPRHPTSTERHHVFQPLSWDPATSC